MQVRVRLFAIYREQAGTEALQLEVPEGTSPAEVFVRLQERFPRLRPVSEPLAVAVNEEYSSPKAPLVEGDEVVFLPPVSGGRPDREELAEPGAEVTAERRPGEPAGLFSLSQDPLDPRRVERLVADERYGAVVTFQGTVRSPNQGRRVVHLDYEAYAPMAVREMTRIGEEIARRWPEVRVAMEHRVGQAGPGEPTVCIAVAAPHRAEAFEACRYAIDALKARVPIWKKEVWTDGESWVRPGSEP